MKKIIVGLLVCSALLTASTVSFGATGKVNTDTARVRSEASTKSTIIDLLSLNDKVEIIEQSGEWYKIKVNNKTGYISKSLLDVDGDSEKTGETSTEENTQTETSIETEIQQEETETTTIQSQTKLTESYIGIISSDVTIKILPSINSMNIAKIEKGTEITIVEIINNWCHLETSTSSGWTRLSIVEEAIESSTVTVATTVSETEKTEETTTEEKTKTTVEGNTQTKTGYVNVETVNVRKEASTSSEKLSSLTKNTEVTILGEENGWYKVKVKNINGYILKKYLSDKKVEEVTSRASDTARQIQETKTTEQPEETATTTTTETSSTTSTGSTLGADVVAFAKQYLGYKYVGGGASPSTGFDCSGFTSYVYKNFGISLDRSSSGQRKNGVAVDKANLQLGDIVCFTGHVGIYIGDNQFIHASNPKGGVKITSLSDSYYVKNYITSRRVLN